MSDIRGGCADTGYSVLKLSTGFAIAALTALRLTVINAIAIVIKAARIKIHQCNAVRYAKFCSQLFIAKYPTGIAMIVASNTGFKRSFDNSITIFCVDDPSTFLTPISLMRFAAVNEAKPNKPRQAIKMANAENMLSMFCCLISVL